MANDDYVELVVAGFFVAVPVACIAVMVLARYIKWFLLRWFVRFLCVIPILFEVLIYRGLCEFNRHF